MLHKDIIRLYEMGIELKMKDNDNVYYNHYLLGKLTCCRFSYVKELYKILKKHLL